jgi:hypothetical protein
MRRSLKMIKISVGKAEPFRTVLRLSREGTRWIYSLLPLLLCKRHHLLCRILHPLGDSEVQA